MTAPPTIREKLLAKLAELQYELEFDETAYYAYAKPILDALAKDRVDRALGSMTQGRSTRSWDEEKHPRGPDGKFGKGSGDKVARRTLDEWAAGDESIPMPDTSDPARGDNQLAAIWSVQGFDAKPKVVSDSDIDAAVAGGATEVWRGITGDDAAEHANQFRTGSVFPGLGMFGNGTYTTTNRGMADEYAKNTGKLVVGRKAQPGRVIRAALPPDANIVDYDDLRGLGNDLTRPLMQVAFDAMDSGDTARQKRAAALTEARNDPGRLASLLGYDAIRKPMTDTETYYVVLNRGKLMVSDTDKEVG